MKTYLQHKAEREKLGIPPASHQCATDAKDLCELLQTSTLQSGRFSPEFVDIDRVPPGVDPAAGVKAAFLARIAKERKSNLLLSILQSAPWNFSARCWAVTTSNH